MIEGKIQKPIFGIGFKILNCVCFTLISIVARSVLSSASVFQLFFMSIGISCAIMLPFMLYKGYPLPDRRVWPHYLALGALGVAGMTLWFHVLTLLPIAYATALSYTTPLFTTILAIMVLKEQLRKRHVVALIAGFLGALMIVRPEMSTLLLGSMLALINALIWATYDLVTKMQTVREKAPVQAFYVLVLHFIFAAPFALIEWSAPTLQERMGAGMIGVLFILNLMALFNAYRLAPLTLLMPFSFSRLIFASVAGMVIFSEAFSWNTILGASVIFASSLMLILLTYRERKTPVFATSKS